MYAGCSQPSDPASSGRGMQRVIYGWWRKEAGALAARVHERMADAPPPEQALALQRFTALVKFMVSVVLPYIDRSYVRNLCSSTLRVLSVAEIGAHAVAAVAAGVGVDVGVGVGVCAGAVAGARAPCTPPPLPQDDVVLGAGGEVDEEALLALTTARLLNPLGVLAGLLEPVEAEADQAEQADQADAVQAGVAHALPAGAGISPLFDLN